jgi:hypothetical protein
VSGRDRPLSPEEKAILDQLSRATDPTKETLEQLLFELETSPIAREVFAAEVFRLRALKHECHSNKSRLPKPVRDELERAAPRTKSFDHLVALADAGLAPEPELDHTP